MAARVPTQPGLLESREMIGFDGFVAKVHRLPVGSWMEEVRSKSNWSCYSCRQEIENAHRRIKMRSRTSHLYISFYTFLSMVPIGGA